MGTVAYGAGAKATTKLVATANGGVVSGAPWRSRCSLARPLLPGAAAVPALTTPRAWTRRRTRTTV